MNKQEAFFIAQEFLSREAKLLDERKLDEWFATLHDEIIYCVPIREAMTEYEDEHAGGGYRIRDNKALIDIRIKRQHSGFAWAEVPPSRTTRVVGSPLVDVLADDHLAVESALIMYRQRGHDQVGEIVPVRRQDELKITPEGVKLFKRTAYIAEVRLTTNNLGVFL